MNVFYWIIDSHMTFDNYWVTYIFPLDWLTTLLFLSTILCFNRGVVTIDNLSIFIFTDNVHILSLSNSVNKLKTIATLKDKHHVSYPQAHGAWISFPPPPPFFKFSYKSFLFQNFHKNFWKKGGVVEKRGEEETKSMPHAPVVLSRNLGKI